MLFRLGIIAALFCLLVDTSLGAEPFKASGQTGLKYSDGLVWLEVDVSGRAEPLHFVLDTGAGVSVIDSKTAKEVGLKPGRRLKVQGTAGTATARWVSGLDAQVAGARLPGKLLCLDLENVSQLCQIRIDGLLGADFLQDRKVQLDFAAGVLRLDSNCQPTKAEAVCLPVKRMNDAWCVVAHVNQGQPEWFRIDTGFDGHLTWCPSSASAAPRKSDSTVALNVGSDSDLRAELRIGALTLPELKTTVLSRQLFARESGLLGMGVLSQYRVTFETGRQRVYLEPAGN